MTEINDRFLTGEYKLMIPHQSEAVNHDYDVRHFLFHIIDRDALKFNHEFLIQIHFELYLYNNTKSLKHLNN